MGKTKKNKKKNLKRKNFMLQKVNDVLKQIIEAKSAYLSHMSHDIRTSINGIIGMTDIAIKNFEKIAKTILENKGITVTAAENGQLAVNLFNNLSENIFDAILMDIRMPIMDGLTAAKTIRKLPKKDAATIPIIAMTADPYDEDMQKTAAAGMNAHLTKPINQEMLFQILRKFYSYKQ